jgi:hypothetical protein
MRVFVCLLVKVVDCTAEVYDHTRTLVAHIWLAEEYLAKDIHMDVLPVDGDSCLSRKAVYNHAEKFAQESSDRQDNDRPGRPIGPTHTHTHSV